MRHMRAADLSSFLGIRPVLLSALLLIFSLTIALPAGNAAFAKENPRYASIVMDADTGMILHQRYADKQLHPASLTKIMTLYMVFEALEQGQLRLNDRVYISNHAASMVPSKLGLAAGSTIRVQDAIYALVTKSANDIAVALAEHLGRSEKNFAYMMTRRAHDLGMANTTFRNASGLHDPRQISSARDMAILARVIIQDYPSYYRYFSRRNFTYAGHTYRNHNRLMESYSGMDGMKTGYIQASGFNLVGSAVRGNRRLIGVVFGGRTAASRNAHMATLLDEGFRKVQDIRVASASAPVPPRKPGIVTAMNTLQNLSPASGVSAGSADGWTQSASTLQNGMFGKLIGEGDNDPAIAERIETGLMAINAQKGQPQTQTIASARPVLANYSASAPRAWAVQIGAFTSRAATDQALRDTAKILPQQYASANPIIAPLKTKNGWLFRGRLSGFTKEEAFQACTHLKECMPVAPYN
ncbi:MAG: D-alanyl-D-alanine carboxypeptidase [Alphaproteobacteria bacterium]|nr:D-alanyl-D-alanine carboxypeptidase [Alphaproteobacteria bacterium]